MKNLSSATRIGTDTGYLNGNLVDGQTLLDTAVLQDMIQFFQKLKAKAAITENGLFDNETNGYQLVEALDKRNFTAKSGIFEVNFFQAYVGSLGLTATTYYPYSIDITHGKFFGLVTYSIDSSASKVFREISVLANDSPDLNTGKTLYSSTDAEIKAYNDRIVFENKGAGTVIVNLTISIIIFGRETF